jgi:aspartokinase/homoserine dehydrogenase 1
MKVLKFGGSSVGTPERILSIVSILKTYYGRGDKFTVVFSAFGGVTDSLIEMAHLASEGDPKYQDVFESFSKRHFDAIEKLLSGPLKQEIKDELYKNHEVLKNLLAGVFLVREASKRTMDYVLSFGERNSAFIISYVLQQHGIPAKYLNARQIIKTNKNFGNAKVDLKLTYEKIKEYYSQNSGIHIVTGFIASAKGGLTTTLGRGGSDYTASLLSAGLEADVLEIWTDVDGVLTADPRKVKKAFTISEMSYSEALEMSHFGAKVIYPPTLHPVMVNKIPLYIKNTFNPEFIGTRISNKTQKQEKAVKGISSISKISLLTIQGSGLFGVPGIAGLVFSSLAQAGINVILITQGSSEYSISFAIDPANAKLAREVLEETFKNEIRSNLVDPIKVENNLSTVAIIGEQMRYMPGIAGRLFNALGKNGINVVAIAQGSSELNISVVVSQKDEEKALNALHDGFFLSESNQLHLFIVGVGLIGKALIAQIAKQSNFLKTQKGTDLKIIGISNSQKMLFHEDGIDLHNWKDQLEQSEEPADIQRFVTKMKDFNLPNSIFVDNTASKDVAEQYLAVLENSISISTPNKIANSADYDSYKHLHETARKRGVLFSYETNVGAGLPVISTLRNLIDSGDKILKIEGVLSGSLSYIFNNLALGKSFSSIVKEALDLGYTEPDPRADLGGLDVMRKILILSREVGFPLEMADISFEPILPSYLIDAPDINSFFDQLPLQDENFTKLVFDSVDQKLCVIAKLEGGKASVRLQKVGKESPFFNLDGSDNMIVFTTERYMERPLVVRGPGAGAEVTAAGVFAEILFIGHTLK